MNLTCSSSTVDKDSESTAVCAAVSLLDMSNSVVKVLQKRDLFVRKLYKFLVSGTLPEDRQSKTINMIGLECFLDKGIVYSQLQLLLVMMVVLRRGARFCSLIEWPTIAVDVVRHVKECMPMPICEKRP